MIRKSLPISRLVSACPPLVRSPVSHPRWRCPLDGSPMDSATWGSTTQQPRRTVWPSDYRRCAPSKGLPKLHSLAPATLPPSAYAKIEAGGQTGVEVIEALAKALSVSPAWLAFNQGPRELPKRHRTVTSHDKPPSQRPA